ncbi:MAG: DEAD/DEAH box helicase [Fimbriimonadales bacterium]|jgi:ATP-dependent helicase YprA (DUF1998 family)|nr:DEAD/DEAH box helicase [Armatimonadota bacterium]MCX7687619.1 DEAD/DEAH box helicase [Fimbriimonadales bacterium]GBC89344.1 DEAD-box ATP-dependent RNA helicase CshB [bacterium HR14]
MSLFELHRRMIEEYEQFVHSFMQIADPRARAFAVQALKEQNYLWPPPMLQLSPAYQYGAPMEQLVQEGVLHPEIPRIFCNADGVPYRLFAHQERALRLAHAGRSYVVTSGTGSGKSFTYLIPIVDYLLRHPEARERVVALIVYPMNALVNSQLRALESLQKQYEQRVGGQFPVRFAKYTGETPQEARQEMRQQPPQILLTNYMMGELLMVRREDQALFGDHTLKFLVFDELHTYRGRQGADVAMLARRLKERYGAEDLRHIGTSATMVSEPGASAFEQRRAVAQFATTFFGHPFEVDDIVDEQLAPATEGGEPSVAELQAVWGQPFPESLDELRRHPLARWVESAFGLERDSAGNLRRRAPRSIREACQPLAEQLGVPVEACVAQVQALLEHQERLRKASGKPLFAVKLHQFISQSSPIYATLEPPDQRAFEIQMQSEKEPNKPLFPLYFCRQCGQDYYRVARESFGKTLVGMRLDESPESEEFEVGYLCLAEWSEDQLPEEWYDERGRLRDAWRGRVPMPLWVRPDGSWSPERIDDSMQAWWQPAPFALCLNCGVYYERGMSEGAKLVGLSSEGRSSATTVLALALLRHAEPTGGARPKLLSFTDNRQDASLQAGHFNDFVRIALLRAALVAALQQKPELSYDEVASAVVDNSGLQLSDYARQPNLNPQSPYGQQVRKTFCELIEYRLYEDLRREWRYTQPNLETLGLLRIEYHGLRELCEDDSSWGFCEALAQRTPEEREAIVRVLLDQFRYKFAIQAPILEPDTQERLRRRCEQELNEYWGLDPAVDDLLESRVMVLERGERRPPKPMGAVLGSRSTIGRYLCQQLRLGANAYREMIGALLERLVAYGLLVRLEGAIPMYQLNAAVIRWCRGDGTPRVSPLYQRGTASGEALINRFFEAFYRSAPGQLATLEAREHTAQVVEPGERERREQRFSGTSNERPLPFLVCSPTMELGIDIADLDLVHLRNVPPTPANYAQRSGRAGRQGQPGLIVAYCGAWNYHDQYFFQRPAEMVSGVVRLPRLDLGSETLLRAHLHALWLNELGLPLGETIERTVDTEQSPELPLRDTVREQLALTESLKQRLRMRFERVIATLPERPRWLTADWIERAILEIPERFDRAFDRWRELFRAVEEQMNRAERQRRAARKRDEQEQAERAYKEAERMRNLLLQIDVKYEESDFYPYRYLASEGFLPGYNFPTLPLRAWVPRKEGEFIERPRVLALREFAPQNIIYHEGSKWEVKSFHSSIGTLKERIVVRKLCQRCGAYAERDHDVCPVCQTPLTGNSDWVELLEMSNVRVRRRERIHSGEEERLRKGYHLTLHYQPAHTPEPPLQADAWVESEKWLRLEFAMVNLLSINHGWRSRGAIGFLVDGETGEFLAETEQERRNTAAKRLRLMTHTTRPVLFVRPYHSVLLENVATRSTLAYALLRGVERVFQLEPGEVEAHWLGEGEHRRLLLVESAEASSGVLRYLVDEREALAEAARYALEICHFDAQGNDLNPDCVRACYRCLLSFQSQLEARLLNRHLVAPILAALARSVVLTRYGERDWHEQLAWLQQQVDPRSELERAFLETLANHQLRLPDAAQYRIESPDCVVDFFYAPRTCVFCDGAVHSHPEVRQRDQMIREQLRQQGYEVIALNTERPLPEQIQGYGAVFGRVG